MEEIATTGPNIIALPGLEGNDPTSLNTLQQFIEPYIGEISIFWWAVWAATLLFLVVRFVVLPLVRGN